MSDRARYTVNEVQRNTFYQMPKFIFEGEFENLGNDARVLYSLLRDRHELSIKNQWINENGEVYLIFSRENMCDMLKLSEKTITKAMNALKKFKLIDEQRRGLGKPNLIYLLSPQSPDFTQNRKIYGSGEGKFTVLEGENFPPNDTNTNKTNSDRDQLQSQSQSQTEDVTQEIKSSSYPHSDGNANQIQSSNEVRATPTKPPEANKPPLKNPEPTREHDEYRKYYKILQKNIEYSDFMYTRYDDLDLIDELINCMLDVICTKGETVKINGEEKNRTMVKEQYLKINYLDIEHVLDRYKEQQHKIKHVHSYLKTMLYTVKQEINHHYDNAVKADRIASYQSR